MKKETYHIVFKTEEDDFYTKGINIEANTIEEAIIEFKKTQEFYKIYVVYLNNITYLK